MSIDKGTIFGATLALILAGAAVAATAQTAPAAAPGKAAPPKGAPQRHPADADGDGKVSKAEARALEARGFTQLDANKDGKVTRPC